MTTPLAERKAAVAACRALFNSFAAQFKPVGKLVFGIPELKPLLKVLQSIADTANAGHDAFDAAKADVGGLELEPSLSPTEEARAQLFSDQASALCQAFEKETGLELLALTVERTADGTVNVGHASLLR